jgi:hypothetical protein
MLGAMEGLILVAVLVLQLLDLVLSHSLVEVVGRPLGRREL